MPRRPRRLLTTAAICLALGGVVAVTQLAGRHAAVASTTSWGSQLVTPALTSTSCADPSHCVAVGSSPDYQSPTSIASSDGGLDWQSGTFPSGSSGPLNGVSCIDAQHCWAAGTSSSGYPTVYATSDGALAWANQSSALPGTSSGGALSAISCVVASGNDDCWAAGIVNSESAVYLTTNGGTSWTLDTLSTSDIPLVTMSCVNGSGAVSCWTTGNQYGVIIYTTSNGGSSWSTQTNPPNAASISSISCPSTTSCFAAGQISNGNYPNSGAIFALSGGSWSTSFQSSPWYSIAGISCVSSTDCVATGLWSWNSTFASQDGAVLTWNGTSWSVGISVSGASVSNTMPGSMQDGGATAVSCPTATSCFATGSEGVIGTQNGGSTWSQLYFIPRQGGANGANDGITSCVSSEICFWAPGDDVVYKTTDGGQAWVPEALPSTFSISMSQTDGPVNGVNALSCADALDCTLGGNIDSTSNSSQEGVILSTADGGTTWSLVSASPTLAGMLDMACPAGSAWCIWTGASPYGSEGGYSGTPASGATLPGVSDYLWNSVSCPNASDCWIVGQSRTGTVSIWATTNGGVSWTSQTPPSGFSLYDQPIISCATSSVCFATGGGSSTLMDTTNGGATWSLVSTLPSGAGPNWLSCPDANHCVASNGRGSSLKEDFISTNDGGSTWATTPVPSPGDSNPPAAVACADSNNCWATSEETNGSAMVSATDGIAAPQGGGISLGEVFGGLNPSEPCFSCYLKAQGAAAQSFVGEPINTATGDFYESLNLFSLPGRGIPISFTLSYDAQFSQSQVESGATSSGPDGWGWTDNYDMSVSVDPASDVATVDQENGSQISFTPSSASVCPSSYTAAAPRITSTLSCTTVGANTVYSLTSNGGLQVDAFTYNSSQQLTKITETDSNGYVTTVLFAQQGSNSMGANYNTACPASASTCTVVSDPASRTFVLEYNSSGQLTGAIDPDGNTSGHTWSFGYDGNGNLTSVTDRNGEVTSFGYDTANSNANFVHDMTSMTPPNGQSGGPDAGKAWAITYDSLGRVSTQTDPQGLMTTLTYSGNNLSPEGGTTTITDPHGNVEVDTYAYGMLTAVTKAAAAAATWTYVRDPATLMPTTVIDPNGHTTTTTDDANGNLLTVTDPVNHTTTNTYNTFNEPLTVTDPLGIKTTYTYDSAGNVLTKVVSGVGGTPTETTTYTYGDSSHPGDVTKVTDPDGDITNYTYDTYGDRATVSTQAPSTSPTVPADRFSYWAISGVGSLADSSGTGHTTVSVSPVTVGDALVLSVKVASASISVSSVTGGGVGSWSKLEAYNGYSGHDLELWMGTLSTTGSATVTVTFSGSVSSITTELTSQEFTAGLGPATAWAKDTASGQSNKKSTTISFPSLTPAGSRELYAGFASAATTAGAGTTSGYTYDATTGSNLFIYNPSISAASAPTGVASPSGTSGAVGALITAAPGSVGTISALGSLADSTGSGTTTVSVSPVTVGDALVLSVKVSSASISVSSVTGGGVGSWSKLEAYNGYSGHDLELWMGKVTATGSGTVTVSFSGSVSGINTELTAQEYTAGFGPATVWAKDTASGQSNASSTTISFPSLTPAGSSELYAGLASASTTAKAGTTSGYTYDVTTGANLFLYNPNVSSASAPTGVASPAGTSGAVGALITASDSTPGVIVTHVSPYGGPPAGGTSVAITGAGFTGATAVKFGTSAASSFTVHSATSITATAPAGSVGTVDVTVTAPVTSTTSDAYNVLGERYCEVSPSANAAGVTCPAFGGSRVADTSTWSYDSDGNVSSTVDADANTTSYLYDADSNQTQVTDPLGNVTKTAYDADDRTSSATSGYGTSSATTTTDTYDIAPGSCPSAPTGTTYCTQVVNGLSQTTTSYYDALDHMIEQAAPNTTAQTPTAYTYDGVGNVLTKTDGSGTATYGYDAANRLTGITYSNTASGYSQPHAVTYMYDADNNRTQMTDGTGTTTYGYDSLERLDSVTDGAGNVVTYGYDSDSNITCVSYPNSGSTTCLNASSGTGLVTYAYNSAGQNTSMTDWLGSGNVTSFGYDLDGNLSTTTFPSGTTTSVTHTYDYADALTDTSYTIGSTATNLAALSPNADELIGTTTPPSGPATTYGYDPLNRVTTGTTAGYTYDAASELTSLTPTGGAATDFSYNTDGQLCWTAASTGSCSSPPTGATTFAYSTVGERVSTTPSGFNPTTYGWDQAGNLVCQTAPNGLGYSCSNPHSTVTTTYAYNGDGLRMSDTPAGGSTQQFTWDVSGSVPQLLEDGTNYYLYGPNVGSGPLEQISISGSTPTYLVSDTTGIREQVGSTGSVVGSMSYDSYGNRCSTCSISTPFGFEGGYSDVTGLLYLVHRYYDPATEQFLSVDPLADETGTPYAFTGGDPVNGSDPSGLGVTEPGYVAQVKRQEQQLSPQCPSGSHVVGGQCTGTGPGQPCPRVNSTTGECASAKWNANNPYASGTSGICLSGGAFFWSGATGSTCLVWNNHQVGVTVTGGGGAGIGYGASLGVMNSNAQCIRELGGGFFQTGGATGVVSASVATNGKTTVEYGGIGTPGFEGYAAGTGTWAFSF